MKIDIRLYQDEGGVWIAEVPAIQGCVSQGQTRDEALTNVRDAIDGCLQVRRELDMPTQVESVTIDIPAV